MEPGEVFATLGRSYSAGTALFVRMQNFKLTNPLNNSQGMTRGATFAAAKRRKDQRSRTRLEVECALRKLTQESHRLFHGASKLSVWLIRVSPRKFDSWDGLPASLKSVVDGIADAIPSWRERDDGMVLEGWDADPKWTWNRPSQAYGGKLVNDVYIVIERE